MIEHWENMGYARALPMGGCAGFEWQEVTAYIAATHSDLSPIEAKTLVDMSRAYAEAVADKNPLSIAPMERKHD